MPATQWPDCTFDLWKVTCKIYLSLLEYKLQKRFNFQGGIDDHVACFKKKKTSEELFTNLIHIFLKEWLSAGLERAFQTQRNWDLSKHPGKAKEIWSPQVHLSIHHEYAAAHWTCEPCGFVASSCKIKKLSSMSLRHKCRVKHKQQANVSLDISSSVPSSLSH